jgi:type I restriction enzyme S subunit
MNAQDLKNSILQLAIQGKLVGQRRKEGTAEELYQQIQEEKAMLIKVGKIKKEKPLPEIKEDGIPFEIPESWKWVRFGEVLDGTHDTPKYVNEGVPLVTSKNLTYGKIDFDNAKLISIEDADKINKRSLVEDSDILFAMIGSIGNPVLVKKNREFSIKNMALFKTISNSLFSMEYLLWYLQLEQVSMKKKASGGVQSFVSLSFLRNYIMPLPPLEEQKRIVAKIEELMPYVEQYGEAHSKFEVFNKKFPEDMKKSILQYAIQGKLVEQRDKEGTAEELYKQIQVEKAKLIKEGKIKKEKPLTEITEEEIPFDIPESWKWVRLGSICEKIGSGSTPTGGKSVYKESGIKFLRSQNIYNNGLRIEEVAYISEEQNKQGSIVKPRDILLNITGGSIGRCALVPDDFDIANINQHVMIIRNIVPENRFFLHYVLISPYVQSMIMSVQVGVSREGLSAEKLKDFLIPIPPFEEQKRIAAKIEELIPFCQLLVR